MNIHRASNRLEAGEVAIVLFTRRSAGSTQDSEYFIGPDGSGWSGSWHMDGNRPADKVIVYYRPPGHGSDYGEIFMAKYVDTVRSTEPHRFVGKFQGGKQMGTTNQTWPNFSGKGRRVAGHLSKG